MAYLVFSGGHALKVDGDASTTEETLASDGGDINNQWTHLQSGDAVVRVNPTTVSYVVDDHDFIDTFGPQQ